jgi:16S rRNA (uracil1498-N3)-methyltransferase
MPRFFVDKEAVSEGCIRLSGDNARHIAQVLRSKPGEEITVCDKEGTDYYCRISSLDNELVEAEIINSWASSSEPTVRITLYQGLPKGDKMELIIQKCIELGIARIVPVATEFSVVKLSGKEDKKLARWNKIAEAAAKQCGRGIIPVVDRVMSFKEAVEDSKRLDRSIIFYEKEKSRGIKQFIADFKGESIGMLIGPEGGFSENEARLAIESGAESLTLGKRILRTETAGMAATSILVYELED